MIVFLKKLYSYILKNKYLIAYNMCCALFQDVIIYSFVSQTVIMKVNIKFQYHLSLR